MLLLSVKFFSKRKLYILKTHEIRMEEGYAISPEVALRVSSLHVTVIESCKFV